MNKPLDQRILDFYEKLTPSEQRLADVLLERQQDIAAYSATELAGRAQVSKATAARLVKRLGYDSFDHLRLQSRPAPNYGSPLTMLERFEGNVAEPLFTEHLANDETNLRRTFARLDPDEIHRAIEILVAARTVYLLGLRNSFSLAHYTRFTLKMLKPDVRLIPVGGLSFAEDVMDMGKEDVLLAIGFRRRPLVLRELLGHARTREAGTIFVTDLSASDTAEIAGLVIRCHSRSTLAFDSYTSAMSVLNYIANGVAVALGPAGRKRLEMVDTLHDELDAFTVPRRR